MKHSCTHDHDLYRSPVNSRRDFLHLATLGAGAALLSALPLGQARAGHTEALLLSCMDFRLMDQIEQYMSGRGMTDKYDHVVLAGASLGALTDKYPAWNRTFWDHLDIAIKLHSISKVMVMDHRDCGAYKVILGKDLAPDPKMETLVHATQLRTLGAKIKEKHPDLQIETMLMALDGKVEQIA